MNTSTSLPGLWPEPRHLSIDSERCLPTAAAGQPVLRPPAASLPREGFRLRFSEAGVRIEAADDAGRRHAERLWGRLSAEESLPAFTLEDWPDFRVRGAMLDISRCKVPTQATLLALVETLADLRINQLQLYTEHTFAFPGHEIVWGDSSPMTPEQLRELDAACLAAGIELVPNLNSFGHFERWLRHPEYHPLAESPDGFSLPWGERRPFGSTLKPEEATLRFLEPLQDAFLPNFTSRTFNIGCDETWELGQGWSAAACAERGKHRVYADFLLKLHRLSSRHGHRIQFWADIILHAPELIPELPKDLVGLVWGYEARHPFAEQCPHFAKAGLEFIVCPGTSGWNSLGGRTENMTANLLSAAAEARRNGAAGLLITDWGDGGHHQPLAISMPGHCLGAGLAWNAGALPDAGWLAAIGRSLRRLEGDRTAGGFEQDRAAGAAIVDLGRLTDVGGVRIHNSSCLNHLLFATDRDALAAKVPVASGDVRRVHASIVNWRGALSDLRTPALASAELELARELMQIACERWLAWHGDAVSPRSALRGRLTRAIGAFEDVWLARNRPGGLHESSGRLRTVLSGL